MTTRAEFLYAIEMRLKSWGFEGELWTDGTRLTIDGKVVKAVADFDIGRIAEVLKDLSAHNDLSPDGEIVAGIARNIGNDLGLINEATCNRCGAPYTAVLSQAEFHSDGICSMCSDAKKAIGKAVSDGVG